MKTCLNCGVELTRKRNEFSTAFARKRFCSVACMGASTRIEAPPKRCPYCGSMFERRAGDSASQFRKRQFCSVACGRAAIGYRRRKPSGTKQCAGCGQLMARRENETVTAFCQRRHCNRMCAGATKPGTTKKVLPAQWCRICGVQMDRRDNESTTAFLKRRTCSQECKVRYYALSRANAAPKVTKYPAEFSRIRLDVLKRDAGVCQLCGSTGGEKSLHVHHIDYVKANCRPTNLISLCLTCHLRTNHRRSYWQAFLTQLMIERSITS